MLQLVIRNSEIIIELGILLLFVVLIRQAIILNKQIWVKTFSSSLTLILLPVVTYGVTSVISGNIALSLGLVGALSIVRFRNPVRSSFELSVLFLYISLGITASASVKYLVLLGMTSIVVLVGAALLTNIYKRTTGKNFFDPSFSEANHIASLEAEYSVLHLELENKDEFVVGVSDFELNNFSYRFTSADFNQLKALKADISNLDGIKNIRLSQL